MVKIREGIAFPDHACPTILDSVVIVRIANGLGEDLGHEEDAKILFEAFEIAAKICTRRCDVGACVINVTHSGDDYMDSSFVGILTSGSSSFLGNARRGHDG